MKKKKIPIFLKVKAQSSFMNVLNYRVLHWWPVGGRNGEGLT